MQDEHYSLKAEVGETTHTAEFRYKQCRKGIAKKNSIAAAEAVSEEGKVQFWRVVVAKKSPYNLR